MQGPDQLLLKVGAPAFVPPSGHKLIIADTDGAIKAMDSTGVKSSIGGGVGWDALQYQRIQALLGSQVDDYMWSHFLNPNEYDITAGSQPASQLNTKAGGVLQGSAGAGSAFIQFAGMKQTGPVIIPVPNQKTSAWAAAVRFMLPNAPSGASWFVDLINCSGSGLGSATVLRINTNTSLTVLQMLQDQSPDGGGTTTTACDATGTVGSGIIVGTFYDALLAYDPVGSILTAQINGVTTATSTTMTNQPTQNLASLQPNTNKQNALALDAMLLAFKRTP